MSRLSAIVSRLMQLKDKLMPKTLIESVDSGRGLAFRYMEFRHSSWEPVAEISESQSAFSQRILLVPDEMTLFRLRHFPTDTVTKQILSEAVELDLARWSPWQEGFDFYYWPKRNGDTWNVAVWVWQKSSLSSLKQNLDFSPTHIVPKRAWKLATLNIGQDTFVHIDTVSGSSLSYAHVVQDFSSLQIVDVVDKIGAQRFWKGLNQQSGELPVFVDENVNLEALSEAELSNASVVRQCSPQATMLSTARQSGVSDWSDPFVWAKPVAAYMCLYIVWLLASGLVLLKQGKELSSYVAETSSSSIEVLDRRANVERVDAVLEEVRLIRKQQIVLESTLAALSLALPKNAWLDHIEYSNDAGWLDITGKSDQSASLAAVLEDMPEVQHAVFLNDIRKDRNTGLESFKIRLTLEQVKL